MQIPPYGERVPRSRQRILLYSEDGAKRPITRATAEKLALSPAHKEYRDKAGEITHIVVCRKAKSMDVSRRLFLTQRLSDCRAFAICHPDGRVVA
jgi:hypothetical protein